MRYEDVISILTILLLTSASVERFLEFVDKLVESLGLFAKKKEGAVAAAAEDRAHKPEAVAKPDEDAENALNNAEGDPSNMVILTAGKVKNRQTVTKKFVLQMSGCLLGVILCVRGDLALFKIFEAPLGSSFLATALDYILTGILIGTGTEPIHTLIRTLQAKHETAKNGEETSAGEGGAPQKPAPKQVSTNMDIQYLGGLNPDTHGNRLRKSNPDMIVYHHTGMQSDMTFLELVRVFRARGFVTGFNTVIMADGSIYNYCRWDARGLHTPEYNERSLGLAFCGCFDTDINKPVDDTQGAMGNLAPTDVQLLAGAKVVALWSLLYQIDVTQKGLLVPHKEIAAANQPTECPGQDFPYARFDTLVGQIIKDWQNSATVNSEILDFSHKKFLFVPSQA